ncbi:hypothetical protein Tco_1157396 [Tanacetum coccineum]
MMVWLKGEKLQPQRAFSHFSVYAFETGVLNLNGPGRWRSMKSALTFCTSFERSSSLIFLEISSEQVNSSPPRLGFDCIESLGSDFPRSTSAVESAEASRPNADSEPPAAYWSSLCMPASIGVEAGGWLRFVSKSELETISKWPLWDPVGTLKDPSLVSFYLDPVWILLDQVLALGFLPLESFFSALEEVLGALNTTGLSAADSQHVPPPRRKEALFRVPLAETAPPYLIVGNHCLTMSIEGGATYSLEWGAKGMRLASLFG